MKKGIKIDFINRKGDSWTWQVKSFTVGQISLDGSFVGLIKIYNDDKGIFQMQFLRGSNTAYNFLPQCSEILEILTQGIIGKNLGMIAEELLQKGYKEIGG